MNSPQPARTTRTSAFSTCHEYSIDRSIRYVPAEREREPKNGKQRETKCVQAHERVSACMRMYVRVCAGVRVYVCASVCVCVCKKEGIKHIQTQREREEQMKCMGQVREWNLRICGIRFMRHRYLIKVLSAEITSWLSIRV